MLEHAIGFLTHGILIGVVAALSSFGTAMYCLRRDQQRLDHQDAEIERTRALLTQARALIDEQNGRLHRLWTDELQHIRLVDQLQNRIALLEREQYGMRRQMYGVSSLTTTTPTFEGESSIPPTTLEGESSVPPALEGDASIPPSAPPNSLLRFSDYLRTKNEERYDADGNLRLGA